MNQIQSRREPFNNKFNPFQNQKPHSGTTFISEINSIMGSSQSLSFGDPLLRVAISSPNTNIILSNSEFGFGMNTSLVILYSGRDGRSFVLEFVNANNTAHVLVLIQDNIPQYWAKTEGSNPIKATLMSVNGNDVTEIIIKDKTYTQRVNPQNPIFAPVAPNNCGNSSNYADCVRCNQQWLEDNYFAIYLLHQIWGFGNLSTLGACMAFCAALAGGGPVNPQYFGNLIKPNY